MGWRPISLEFFGCLAGPGQCGARDPKPEAFAVRSKVFHAGYVKGLFPGKNCVLLG